MRRQVLIARPSLIGIICPLPMSYLTALSRPPRSVLLAPTVAWGYPTEARSVRPVTRWPLAAREKVLAGGVAHDGGIGPARAVCAAMIAFMTREPASIITQRNSMAAITASRETAWYPSTKPTYRPIWIELRTLSDIITPTGWAPGHEDAPRGDAAVDPVPAHHFLPRCVTPMIRDFTF